MWPHILLYLFIKKILQAFIFYLSLLLPNDGRWWEFSRLSHSPSVLGISSWNLYYSRDFCKQMWVLVLQLVLFLPCIFCSSLRVPSYLEFGSPTLLESLDLSLHNFDWLFDDVQFRVDLNLFKRSDKHIIRVTLPKIRDVEYIMHVIELLG